MDNHLREALDVMKELTAMYPTHYPTTIAEAFVHVSKHIMQLRTVNIDAKVVLDYQRREKIEPDEKSDFTGEFSCENSKAEIIPQLPDFLKGPEL